MPKTLSNHPWQSRSTSTSTCYFSQLAGTQDIHLKQAAEYVASKAVSLLDNNIQEQSLYLLFDWHEASAQLTAVVTNADKNLDSPYRVELQLPELQAQLAQREPSQAQLQSEQLAAQIGFFLSDFLASYSPFFSYSLVAIFHSSSRAQSQLL